MIRFFVITLLFFLTSCVSKSNVRPRENCRYEAVTYGDFINCTIKLDELQNGR